MAAEACGGVTRGAERLSVAAASVFLPPSGWAETELPGARCWAPDPDVWEAPATVCVLGAFDGVHRGHRALVETARAQAERAGLPLVAATFDPDPSAVVGRAPEAPLLSCADRRRFLETCGVDAVLAFSFTPQVAALDYRDFVASSLVPVARPAALVVGEGFRLGARGTGTVERLGQEGARLGFSVTAAPLLRDEGAPVSASRIRSLVQEGSLAEAARLLGRPHLVRGTVAHGRGEGTSFGFPTANVAVSGAPCLPGSGVFAGMVAAGGRAWPAAVNVGAPPSFGGGTDEPFLEAFLLGFSGDLYGRVVEVALLERLRPSRPFASLDQLKAAVRENIAQCADLLGEEGVRLYTPPAMAETE